MARDPSLLRAIQINLHAAYIRGVLLGNRTGSIELVYPVPRSSRNNDSIERGGGGGGSLSIFFVPSFRSRTCSSPLPWIDNPDGRHDSISVMAIAASWRPCKERNRKKRSGGQEEEAARVSASGTWYRRGFMNGRGTPLSEQGCIGVRSYLVRVSDWRLADSLNR